MRHRLIVAGLASDPPSLRWGLMATAVAIAAATLVVYPLKDVAPAVSLGVVYIPGVLLISTVWGWRLGLVSARAERARL